MKMFSGIVAVGLALAADKGGPIKGEAFDKSVKVEATAFLDKASINQAVGGEMEPGLVVIAVIVTPAAGKKLSIDLDDFLLRSDRSGETSNPYSPSQIAGSSVMKVSSRSFSTATGTHTQNTGPVWGGMGGGRPSQLPGGGQAIGNGTSQASGAVAAVDDANGKTPENPLLAKLKEKILPGKDTVEPVSGQLYFLMESKQRPKDLELLYKTETGRISVRFKQPDK